MLTVIRVKAGRKHYSFKVPEQADDFTVFKDSGVLAVTNKGVTVMCFSPKGWDNATPVFDDKVVV